MEMRPAMALIPSDGEVQKVPVIQRAVLCCIFFSLCHKLHLAISLPILQQFLQS